MNRIAQPCRPQIRTLRICNQLGAGKVKSRVWTSVAIAPMMLMLGGANVLAAEAATEVGELVVVAPQPDDYSVDRSATATKTETALRDVPQAVSVIPDGVIHDQAMQSMADVFRYVPGVGSAQGEGNRDALVIRGNASTADFYVDGVRDDIQSYRDLYNAARVEVLKGPNAMIFGRGGGGGVVNRVTKRADGTALREVSLEAGTDDHRRIGADFDQPLTAAWSTRAVGVYEHSDSFRDFVTLRRWGLNPTLRYSPNDRTGVVLGYEHFDDHRTADRGVPSFGTGPSPTAPSTFFGAPDQSFAAVRSDVWSAVIEHRLGERVTLTNHAVAGDYDKFYQNIYPGAAADLPSAGTPTRATLSAYKNSARRKNLFSQTDLVWQTRAGGLHHTLLAGTEFGRQTTDNVRNTGYFAGGATTLFVPFSAPTVLGAPASFHQSATDADNHVQARVAAAYIQDQIELGKLQLVAGARYDRFGLAFNNHRTGLSFGRADAMVSPRLGLVFKPVEPVSLYASYSVSFLPSSGDQFSSLTATTQALKPERFENHEVGIKWAVTAHLDLTLAAYDLLRDNTTARDPLDASRAILAGAQRSRGLELGLSGRVNEHWQVIGGYARQSAKITEATVASVTAGKHVALTPANTASLWNKVALNQGWALGLGVIHQDRQFAAIDNIVVLPGFTRLDGAVFVQLTTGARLQVNVENLTDRTYYPTSNGANNIAPGAPRTLRVSLRTRF